MKNITTSLLKNHFCKYNNKIITNHNYILALQDALSNKIYSNISTAISESYSPYLNAKISSNINIVQSFANIIQNHQILIISSTASNIADFTLYLQNIKHRIHELYIIDNACSDQNTAFLINKLQLSILILNESVNVMIKSLLNTQFEEQMINYDYIRSSNDKFLKTNTNNIYDDNAIYLITKNCIKYLSINAINNIYWNILYDNLLSAFLLCNGNSIILDIFDDFSEKEKNIANNIIVVNHSHQSNVNYDKDYNDDLLSQLLMIAKKKNLDIQSINDINLSSAIFIEIYEQENNTTDNNDDKFNLCKKKVMDHNIILVHNIENQGYSL